MHTSFEQFFPRPEQLVTPTMVTQLRQVSSLLILCLKRNWKRPEAQASNGMKRQKDWKGH